MICQILFIKLIILDEWFQHYKKLIYYWELEFENHKNIEMLNIIKSQHKDANKVFKNFIIRNYENWINETENISNTTLSHNLFRKN